MVDGLIGALSGCNLLTISVWRIGTRSFTVMKSASSSASEAEDITNLMTWAMVNTGPFQCGTGSFSARKTWAPALGFIVES